MNTKLLIDFIFSKKFYLPGYIIIACITSYLTAICPTFTDFDVFLHAASKIPEKNNIYLPPFIDWMQYYYSIFFASILVSFSKFPIFTKTLWGIFNYYLGWDLFQKWIQYFNFKSEKQQKLFIFIALVLSFQFFAINISRNQMTILIVWIVFFVWEKIDKKEYLLPSILLAFIINIKIIPIIFLCFWIYKGKFRFALYTFCFTLFFYIAPLLWLEKSYFFELFYTWIDIINPKNAEHIIESHNFQLVSLSCSLPVYFYDSPNGFGKTYNFLALTPQQMMLTIHFSRLFLILLSLAYLGLKPFQNQNSRIKTYWQISYFCLLIPLIFPHQPRYALFAALPMTYYLLWYFISKQSKTIGHKASIFFFVLAMIFYSPLNGLDILGRDLFYLSQSLKFLTLSTLFLIPLSWFARPRESEN